MSNYGFWISFAFTCGIAVGRFLPKLLEWLEDRHTKKLAADVVEVGHGSWIVTDADDGMCEEYAGFIEFKCSECGLSVGFENGQYDWYYGDPITWKYCPICGAKMDGERSEKWCFSKKHYNKSVFTDKKKAEEEFNRIMKGNNDEKT